MTVCSSYRWTWIDGSVVCRFEREPWFHVTSREPWVGAALTKSIGCSVIGVILAVSWIAVWVWVGEGGCGHEVPDMSLSGLELAAGLSFGEVGLEKLFPLLPDF